MSLARSHPLYELLHPCGDLLLYDELHALAQGQYAEVAQRLQASAERQRYLNGFIHGSLVVMLLYVVPAAVIKRDVFDIVWGCMLVMWLALNVPRSRRQLKAAGTAVARLRQLAASRAESNPSCS